MKSKSHAHPGNANRCNQRRDLETKLVERHQQREHKDQNSGFSDDQQAHRRLLDPSFEASIGELRDPAGQENADYQNDNRAKDLESVPDDQVQGDIFCGH
jgi:hypothetical protein